MPQIAPPTRRWSPAVQRGGANRGLVTVDAAECATYFPGASRYAKVGGAYRGVVTVKAAERATSLPGADAERHRSDATAVPIVR